MFGVWGGGGGGLCSKREADSVSEVAATSCTSIKLNGAHVSCAPQVEGRRKELGAARADGSDATAAASKTRRRALQDCEVAIGEYDTEMGARQAGYDAALAAHTELLANIQVGGGECGHKGGKRVAGMWEAGGLGPWDCTAQNRTSHHVHGV